MGCDLAITKEGESWKVSGNKCPRGEKYGIAEMTDPRRMVPTTVAIEGSTYPVIPVKTSAPIPKDKIFEVMKVLSDVKVKSPIKIGDVVVKNILSTGVDIVATKNG